MAASSCGYITPIATNTNFQHIVVPDGEGRFVIAVLRRAKRPSGKEIKPFLRRLLRAIRAHWPKTEILLRADSHCCGPEVLDWRRASGLDYILGVAPATTLRRHVESLEASVKARFEAAPRDGKLRRFKEFLDGAQSWSRIERIIVRVAARPQTSAAPKSQRAADQRGSIQAETSQEMGLTEREKEWAPRRAGSSRRNWKKADIGYKELAERLNRHGLEETETPTSPANWHEGHLPPHSSLPVWRF